MAITIIGDFLLVYSLAKKDALKPWSFQAHSASLYRPAQTVSEAFAVLEEDYVLNFKRIHARLTCSTGKGASGRPFVKMVSRR